MIRIIKLEEKKQKEDKNIEEQHDTDAASDNNSQAKTMETEDKVS